MSWAVGYDTDWHRDIGYGVPAICDFPNCGKSIDRGLYYVCGGQAYGGEDGCGLYFCRSHLLISIDDATSQKCERCDNNWEPFEPTSDVREWVQHKLTDQTWQRWRDGHPTEVRALEAL